MLRLTTIAAARDIGENAPRLRDATGTVVASPPHRGIGRTRLLRAMEQRTPALSRAVTQTTSAVEQVTSGERRAARARTDLAAARLAMPPRPRQGDFGRVLWIAMVAAFAAIEGIATRALWAEVTDDKRLGLVFAVVFAIVFTASVHILATWLWGLADDMRRLREVTLVIVAAMIACAGGLLVVAGFERDKILISNVAEERAQREQRLAGSAAGQAVIAGGLTPAGATSGAAQAAGGLLGTLPNRAAAPQAPPGAATTAPSASAGGLTGALPSAAATTTARSSRTTVDDEADVSFRFVIWLNFLVLLAMILFTRGRTLATGYRHARRRVRKLERRDKEAREQLVRAEAKRHDTSATLDYCERVLFPIAQRCASDEQQLDALFVDQIGRSALAAGHGPVDVRLETEPDDPLVTLNELLGTELITLTAAGIRLPIVPFSYPNVLDGLAGGPDDLAEPPPVSPFEPTAGVEPAANGAAAPDGAQPDAAPVSRAPRPRRRRRRGWGRWGRWRAAGHDVGDDPDPETMPPADEPTQTPPAGEPPPRRDRDAHPGQSRAAGPRDRATGWQPSFGRRDPMPGADAPPSAWRNGTVDGDDFEVGELIGDAAPGGTPPYPRDAEP